MFQVKQHPFKPFALPAGRTRPWYDLRPQRASEAPTQQYFNCDDGPTTLDSYDTKFAGALAFFRAWFGTQRPAETVVFNFRIRLTFSADGELVPACMYPLLALYAALAELPEAPPIKRISVNLTKTHWFLWREALADEPTQLELPLETAVDWGRVGPGMGLETEVTEGHKELLPGCYWGFPRVLRDVLTPYLSYLGLGPWMQSISWYGKSPAEMVEDGAALPPLPFRF
jgi:hypothetical protein